MTAMKVTGLGQCAWDYLATVENYPAADTKCETGAWFEQGGGPVATALVSLSRLGIDCAFHGVTGDDETGEKIRQSLSDEGIETEGLLKREGGVSQKAFIAVEKEGGKRTIFWQRPSGEVLKTEELGDDFLEKSDFLLLDGLMTETSLFAAKKARGKGVPVLLDAGSARPGMVDLARECDYVVGSERFAKDIGWEGNPAKFSERLTALRLGLTTITLGERGSLTFKENKLIEMPAFPVEVVDTTGAGDVFHGGYIYGLLQDLTIEEVLRFASVLAAMKCRKSGGRTGLPTLDEVTRFLDDNPEVRAVSRTL